MEIEKVDSLGGYSSGPSDFSTIHDIIMDSIFYLAGILILGFFCVLLPDRNGAFHSSTGSVGAK